MILEYTKFFVNGGILGVIAMGLQMLIYRLLGGDSAAFYALASALTYAPLVTINFMIQRTWIFNRPGLFPRFVSANLGIMLLVSLLSPICSQVIDLAAGAPWGERGGFALAALLGSIPSFFIKRHWVFEKRFLVGRAPDGINRTSFWQLNDLQKACRSIFSLRWMLVSIVILYIVYYLALPAAPGNSPYDHPLGWWGWFDQGQYLKAANALLQRDFSPDKHFYPPLYPAAGAFFLNWSSGHPYFLLNLFCLLWFAFVFIRVGDRYIPRWGGVILLFGTTIFNLRIFENYLIPWTTTLSAALLASGILGLAWLQDVLDRKNIKIGNWQVFFVAACLGLLAPTRPGDAAVGGVLGLALLIGYGYARRFAAEQMPSPSKFLAVAIVGFSIGPAIYFGFNKSVFGTLSGGYMQIAAGNGFFLADLPEKFVSLWLDGETLYGESNSGLTQHYPWLFLSLAGLVWVLFRGDFLLRVLVIATSLLFVVYMPYGDLLPNGIWRFLNIHYFKWTFPFLALFAWLVVNEVLSGWRRREGWGLPALLLIVIPMLLLTLHFEINIKYLPLTGGAGSGIHIELPSNEVDFIDIKGLNGGFTEVYFGGHRLLLDGHEMKRVRDYRVLLLGSKVRLLFIRPTSGRSIEFMPDMRLVRHDAQMAAQTGAYHFELGMSKLFRNNGVQEMVSGYRLGDVIDFSQQGRGQFYAVEGWSDPEEWGRWSVNEKARVAMRISEYTERHLILELTYGALVQEGRRCQKIVILANGHNIGDQENCVDNDGGIPKLYRYALPAGLVFADGLLEISISTPDAISPRQLGINDDPRTLGIGLRTLRINY
ncbi:MAG: hypothetical protein PHT19_07320 [Methylococcus sp.]|nr:hypothetical protein [Methylococcus sp.]